MVRKKYELEILFPARNEIKEIDLQNADSGVMQKFEPRGLFVLDTIDWGVASITTKTIFYFPSEKSEELLAYNWAPRNIQIVGYIVAPTEVEIGQASKQLTEFIDVQKEIKILYNGYYMTFLPIQKVRYATDEQNDNEILRKFQITGIAIDPLWHNTDKIFVGSGVTSPMFHFPLIFNQDDPSDPGVVFGRKFSAGDIFIEYEGVISRGMIITILSAGSISDIQIVAIRNGETVIGQLTLLGSYPADSTIIIDTRDGFMKVTSNGVDVTQNVSPDSDWLRLQPGETLIKATYTATEPVDVFVEVKQESLFEVQD